MSEATPVQATDVVPDQSQPQQEGQAGPPRSLSLKWRLSLALIGLSLGLVTVYIFLAKQTFESDKIAYVFESRQAQLDSLAKEFTRKLERGIADANSVLLGFDSNSKQLNSVAQKVFDSQKTLLGVEVTQGTQEKPLIQIAKTELLRENFSRPLAMPADANFYATGIGESTFLVAAKEPGSNAYLIKALVEIPDLLSTKDTHGVLVLVENGKVLASTKEINISDEIKAELGKDRPGTTMVRKLNGENYLISTNQVEGTDLKLVSFYPEAVALGALGVLYKRSLIFVSFSAFLTILIALFLSNGLTRKLILLTDMAGEIGKGDFTQKPKVTSSDEVGVLQMAFLRMSDEIQKLLIATRETARMEEELKTARLVQERLFPKEATFATEGFKLSGFYDTSTECGGDWWFYYRQKDDLIVLIADATGHGTPAALSTAASRSLFANLEERENMSLADVARAWDKSIAASSGQKVYMTAFIMKLNVKTGKGVFLSASHEPPILFKPDGEASFLEFQESAPLGELTDHWVEVPFEMKSGERVLLYTDGLWAVESPEKKVFSELRFVKKIDKLFATEKDPEAFIQAINAVIQDHRKGTTYPDDVSLVAIDRL